ncbi:MAG: hypothetical protein GOV00_04085 [Candidatus Altiarchaeota archaeon]|nr:hypothetical protein [Candidatus Altiarchaeota archaeon]
MSDKLEILVESTGSPKTPGENEFSVCYLPIEDEKVRAHLSIFGNISRLGLKATAELIVIDVDGKNKMFSKSDSSYMLAKEIDFHTEDVTDFSEHEIVKAAVEIVINDLYRDHYYLRYLDLDRDAVSLSQNAWDIVKHKTYTSFCSNYIATVIVPSRSKFEAMYEKLKASVNLHF